MTDPDKPIKSRTAAHKYIVDLGYKLSRSKMYADYEAGKIGKQEDGTFSADDDEFFQRRSSMRAHRFSKRPRHSGSRSKTSSPRA